MFVRRNKANLQNAASIAAEQLATFVKRAPIEFKPIEVLPPRTHDAEVDEDETRTRSTWPEATLFVTDAELIRRIGVPEGAARNALRMLDRDRGSGFPAKQPLWGGRRYWPAVRLWFDQTSRPQESVLQND